MIPIVVTWSRRALEPKRVHHRILVAVAMPEAVVGWSYGFPQPLVVPFQRRSIASVPLACVSVAKSRPTEAVA